MDKENPKFEIDFQSPFFALRVGGEKKSECEETFFTIFKGVGKSMMKKKPKRIDVMHG